MIRSNQQRLRFRGPAVFTFCHNDWTPPRHISVVSVECISGFIVITQIHTCGYVWWELILSRLFMTTDIISLRFMNSPYSLLLLSGEASIPSTQNHTTNGPAADHRCQSAAKATPDAHLNPFHRRTSHVLYDLCLHASACWLWAAFSHSNLTESALKNFLLRIFSGDKSFFYLKH